MVSNFRESTKSSLVAIAILAASLGAVVAVSGLTSGPTSTILACDDDYGDDGLGGC